MHATKSIANNQINKSDKAQKTSENTWRKILQRCLRVTGLGAERWGSVQLTGGAVASVMVAVLVGIVWHDDARREQGMQESVAAASAPTTAASTAQAKAVEPVSESLAIAPDSAAADASHLARQAAPAKSMPNQDVRSKRENPSTLPPGINDRANSVASAPAAMTHPSTAAEFSEMPSDRMASARASVSAAAVAPTPAGASAPTVATAPAAAAISPSTSLSQVLIKARSADVICTTQTPTATAAQSTGELQTPCNTAAAHALLSSALLRRWLGSAVAASGGALPSDAHYVQWRVQQTSVPPLAVLVWSPAQRLLHWQTSAGQYAVTLSAQDAVSFQALVTAVAEP